MDVLTLVAIVALAVALIAHILLLHLKRVIKQLRAALPPATAYSSTAIASIHYNRSDGLFWIETLADIDDIAAPELVKMGNFVYGWTQSLWKAKVDNAS